jgi:DHA1 family bicyclomycin/chloramphenicol resistance-like MFS transporter
MLVAQIAHVAAGALLVVISWTRLGGVYGMGAALFVFLSCNGTINPMSAGAAMRHYAVNAGMASALLGALIYAAGFAVSLLMGAIPAATPAVLGGVMAACAVVGLAIHLSLRRRELSTHEVAR